MNEDPPFLVTAFANRLSKSSPKARVRPTTDQAIRPRRVRPTGIVGASCARHLGARPPRLPHPRAGLARLAEPPQPGALLRHQPSELRAQPCAAPGLLSHGVVRAGPVVHQRRHAHLRWRFPAARCAPRLLWMRVPGALQLAAAPSRPDRLCRLHAHRLPGTLNELPLPLKESAMLQPITVPLEKREERDDGEQSERCCRGAGDLLPAFCRILQLDDGAAPGQADVRSAAAGNPRPGTRSRAGSGCRWRPELPLLRSGPRRARGGGRAGRGHAGRGPACAFGRSRSHHAHPRVGRVASVARWAVRQRRGDPRLLFGARSRARPSRDLAGAQAGGDALAARTCARTRTRYRLGAGCARAPYDPLHGSLPLESRYPGYRSAHRFPDHAGAPAQLRTPADAAYLCETSLSAVGDERPQGRTTFCSERGSNAVRRTDMPEETHVLRAVE